MTRLLVVGADTGNIGKEFVDSVPYHDGTVVRWPTAQIFDVRKEREVELFFRNNGPFDEVVYCAGINQLAWAANITTALMYEHWAVNAMGIVNVLGAHKHLWPDHPVSAVVVTSDAGHNPMRGSVAYCSSKAAADMVVQCLAREWGGDGWRVNAVAPAMVADTPMTRYIDAAVPGFRGWTEEYAAAYEAQQLQGRGRISKGDVVAAIWFALRGPSYMNGSVLDLSGGK